MKRLDIILGAVLCFAVPILSLGQQPQSQPVQPPPGQPLAAQPAAAFPQPCPHPFFPSQNATVADSSCGPAGNGGPDQNQNVAKNNFCAANQQGQPTPLSFPQFKQLQTRVDNDHSIAFGQQGTATRHAGPQVNRARLQQMGEGRLVVVEGIMMIARQEGGEGVNCKGHVTEDDPHHDIHISIVPPGPNVVECDGIVVEMSPHHRLQQWTKDNVMAFAQNKRVRVTGQVMFDSSHVPCVNRQEVGTNPRRMSLWEVHPIYRFEVCTANCNTNNPTWAKLEDLVDHAPHQ